MKSCKPVVGEWYRDGSRELFEVVAIDAEDETIEIQYFDGSVTEMEFEAWQQSLNAQTLESADAPEDWSGAIDMESDDLAREVEDVPRPMWGEPHERSLRR